MIGGMKRETQLSGAPTWDTPYQGLPDARYTNHGGMYFEVTMSRLFGWWHVDRIDSMGRYLGESMTVPTLGMAQAAIRVWSGVLPPATVAFDRLATETMLTAEEMEEMFDDRHAAA